jgi:hypothetical protein
MVVLPIRDVLQIDTTVYQIHTVLKDKYYCNSVFVFICAPIHPSCYPSSVYLRALSIAHIIQRQMILRLVNHKLGEIWKGAVVQELEILPRKLPGDTDKSHENFVKAYWIPSRCVNLVPSVYEAGALSRIWLWLSLPIWVSPCVPLPTLVYLSTSLFVILYVYRLMFILCLSVCCVSTYFLHKSQLVVMIVMLVIVLLPEDAVLSVSDRWCW